MDFLICFTYNIVMTQSKTRKLTCVVTGRQLLATRDYYDRKLKKAGDEHKLHREYICREAKNMLMQGTSVDRVREILGVTGEVQDVPQDVIDNVTRQTNISRGRRINNIINTSVMMNSQTDDEVKQYVERLKHDKQ